MPYSFSSTQDWFSHAIPQWEQFLRPLDGTPCQCIEIGSHEGRSAMWIADNLLSHPESRLYCVDPWNDDKPWNHRAAEARFDANRLECERSRQIIKCKKTSRQFLVPESRVALCGDGPATMRDFIYVDGCHEAKNVMEDFVLAWPLLKSGGILVFDDYPWTHPRHYRCPGPAIDCILDLWAPEMDVLHKEYQVIVRKR